MKLKLQLDENATVTAKAVFGSTVSQYTDKNITGYKLDRVLGTPLTIKSYAAYGSTVNTYNQQTITGYVFTRVENLGLTVSENEANNVIRVYYTEVVEDEDSVQTADMNNVLVLIAIMVAAGCAVLFTAKKKAEEK